MDKKPSCILEDYEVTRYTMAILPEEVQNKTCSRVLEVDGEYIVAKKPIEIVEESCKYYGSSFQGRREGTKELIGVTHKAPIAVDPSSSIYLFPTASPSRPQCSWISHAYVHKHQPAGHENTTVTFSNKKTIDLNVSQGSFESQLYRTAQLRTLISARIESAERRKKVVAYPLRKIRNSFSN